MTTYVSTNCLVNRGNVLDVLETYSKAGLTHVELGVSNQYIEDLSRDKFDKFGLHYLVHNYFPPPKEPFIINLASIDPVILKRSKEQIKESLRFCHSLGIDLFTFHGGFRIDPDNTLQFSRETSVVPYEKAFDVFINSVDEINSYAKQLGVRIAVENNVLSDYNVIDGQNPFLLFCHYDEFKRLWQQIPSTNVGILLDLGHLNVTSHWLDFDKYEFIDLIKDRIFAFHVHDNNGRVDQHQGLGESSWCLEVISEKRFTGLPIILESSGLTIEQIIQQVRLLEEKTY